MMSDVAWRKQSRSLIAVQKRGGELEKTVRRIVGWTGGHIIYDPVHRYRIQVDTAFPSTQNPEIILSVTYTKPDTRGHSNENKLHLKIGELALLKNAYPEIRMVLAIGGSHDDWLTYVLRVFQIFYDEVLFLWTGQGRDRLKEISRVPNSVPLKNETLWQTLRNEWRRRALSPPIRTPPCSLVRYEIVDLLKKQRPIVRHPRLIQNEIARLCLQRSHDADGAEWTSYLKQRWNRIEMSRNYFNPVEASVEMSLSEAGLHFQGGIAQDVPVRSLLHDFDMPGTSLSEDFSLYSTAIEMPVYIQCKASGGGRSQHGKNIQNRTKEQITRGILYCCTARGPEIIELAPKRFHWIAVVDGNWGVTEGQPLKYIHMLELAGYDKIISAADLLDDHCTVKRVGNPLTAYLTDTLRCR